MESITTLWSKIPASWKKEGASIWHTFIAAFAAELLIGWNGHGDAALSVSIFQSILFAAFRSGVKGVILWIVEMNKQSSLPQKKKSKD